MKAVWLAAGLIALGAAVVTLHDILLVFFAGAVFAIPLRRATIALSSRFRVPTFVALIAVILSVAGAAAAVVWAWETLLAQQTAQLVSTLPKAFEALTRAARTEPWASRIATIVPDPGVLLTGAGGFIGGVRGVIGGTLAAALDVAIVVFTAVCFAAEPQTYVKGMLRLVQPALLGVYRLARVTRCGLLLGELIVERFTLPANGRREVRPPRRCRVRQVLLRARRRCLG